jgi:N-acetylneuraminic acid mutarotase
MRWSAKFVFFCALCSILVSCEEPRLMTADQWTSSFACSAVFAAPLSKGIAGPITGLLNGALLVAGGNNFPDSMPWLGGTKRYYDRIFLLREQDGDLVAKEADGRLPVNLSYAAVCSIEKGVFVAGGENEQGPTASVFLLMADDQNQCKTIPLPSLPLDLTNAQAAAIGEKVYVAGGENNAGTSSAFFCINLADEFPAWRRLPDLPLALSHMVFIPVGNPSNPALALIGGRTKTPTGISKLHRSHFQFDPSSEKWVQKRSLPYPLTAGTGIALDEDCLLLFGGDMGNVFSQVEKKLVAITSTEDPEKKQLLETEKAQLQREHPGFSTNVLLYESKKDRWSVAGSLPGPTPVTTTAVQWKNKVYLPCGEIRPGVRTTAILSATLPNPRK